MSLDSTGGVALSMRAANASARGQRAAILQGRMTEFNGHCEVDDPLEPQTLPCLR